MVVSPVSAAAQVVFSSGAIREVMQGNFEGRASRSLLRLRDAGTLELDGDSTVADGLKALSHWCSMNYRWEMHYVNLIANKIFLGRHNVNTATMLTQFRTGQSIADCVVVNGSCTVYEVKTELDNPTRLHQQLTDYSQVFNRIHVVTHHSQAFAYSRLLEGTPFGVLQLSERGTFSEIKPAESDSSALDSVYMIKSLRRSEIRKCLNETVGRLPAVPNTLVMRQASEAAATVPPQLMLESFNQRLRERKIGSYFSAPEIAPLRQACLAIKPTEQEVSRLMSWVGSKIGTCITPTFVESNSNS